MCRVLKVHRSGYYAWLEDPLSARAKANEALTLKIREFYDQSVGIYGSPRIFCDLREAGLACGENRVARLMKAAQIKSVRGYRPACLYQGLFHSRHLAPGSERARARQMQA